MFRTEPSCRSFLLATHTLRDSLHPLHKTLKTCNFAVALQPPGRISVSFVCSEKDREFPSLLYTSLEADNVFSTFYLRLLSCLSCDAPISSHQNFKCTYFCIFPFASFLLSSGWSCYLPNAATLPRVCLVSQYHTFPRLSPCSWPIDSNPTQQVSKSNS